MYTLTLTGSNKPDASRLESIDNLAELFSITNDEAEHLLNHAPIVIKRELSIEQAEAFKLTIDSIGLETEINNLNFIVKAEDTTDEPSKRKSLIGRFKSLFKR